MRRWTDWKTSCRCPPAPDLNLYEAPAEQLSRYERLPVSLEEARAAASESAFVRTHVPEAILKAYGM